MKEKDNENLNIDELLLSEKQFRDSGDYIECLNICLQICKEIQLLSNKYDIISKLFFYQNQSNYVRIFLMHYLIQDDNFINSEKLKKKYYQLLIDSFKNETSKDFLKQKNDIIRLYENNIFDNFDEIDKYIVNFVSTPAPLLNQKNEQYETEKNSIMDDKIFSHSKTNSLSFSTNSISSSSTKRLDQKEKLIPQSGIQTSYEDTNISIQKIMDETEKKVEIKQLLKKYKINSRLPLILMSVSANLNKNQFLELIKNTFLKLNYNSICNIKDSEFENITIYQYNPKNCCEKIKYLLKNKYIKNEFQVLITLKSDENKFDKGIHTFLNDINERKISIKSIKGKEKNIIQFFIKFLSKFCLSINKIKIIKQSKCLLKYNIEESIQKIIQNKKNEIIKSMNLPKDILFNSENFNYRKLLDDETYVEKTNSQAKKFYELYKILSKGEYELGKSIKLFIEQFKKKYQSMTITQINTIDTKNIMMEVVKILELCTNTLNSSYNNYDYNNNDITYFSLASEQFLFNKIYYIIYDIYDKKYQKLNNDFLLIQKEINEKLNIHEILQKIGVKTKFISEDSIPYKSVIDIVNMIPLEKSIKKKFEILTKGSLEIRTYILEQTNGKYELDSMDDELPIIIYIATQVKVPNLFAELKIVEEYIRTILRDDLIQNKMVTNLYSSLMFISQSWNNENLTFDKNYKN
jgi:hypothetical protein